MFGTTIDKAYPSFPTQSLFDGYSTNNKYQNFPPLMSDGRSVVAGATSEAVMNAKIIQQNGIENNTQYREFMTNQATQIREENMILASNDIGYIYRSESFVK